MIAVKMVTSEKILEESRTRGEGSPRWSLLCRVLASQPAPPPLSAPTPHTPISCTASGFLTIIPILQMRKLKVTCSRPSAKNCLSQDSNPDFTLSTAWWPSP